jgi:tellurite resistance protein TehA-like permease
MAPVLSILSRPAAPSVARHAAPASPSAAGAFKVLTNSRVPAQLSLFQRGTPSR